MWLLRSVIVWVYTLTFLVKSVLRSFEPSDLFVVVVHITLLHKLAQPYVNRNRALSALRRRALCAAIVSNSIEYGLYFILVMLIFIPATIYLWNKSADLDDFNTRLKSFQAFVEKDVPRLLEETLHEDSPAIKRVGFGATVLLLMAPFRTMVAWLLTKGYTQMAGEEQLMVEDVVRYTLMGSTGLSMGGAIPRWIFSGESFKGDFWNSWMLKPAVDLLWFGVVIVRAGLIGVAVGGFRMLRKKGVRSAYLIGVFMTIVLNLLHDEFGWERGSTCSILCLTRGKVVSFGIAVMIVLGVGWLSVKNLRKLKEEEGIGNQGMGLGFM